MWVVCGVVCAISQRLGTAASAAHQIATQLFWFLAFVPEALTPVAQMLIGQVRTLTTMGVRASEGFTVGVRALSALSTSAQHETHS